MKRSISHLCSAAFVSFGLVGTLGGLAWGVILQTESQTWRCPAACNSNQIGCPDHLVACCCGGTPGGPYGTCSCQTAAWCAGDNNPPCTQGWIESH